MSVLEGIAFGVAALWMCALTVVLVVLVRQMELLRIWATEQTATPSDGLEVGMEVPGKFEALVDGVQAGELTYLLFLGGNCQPCREFALEARDSTKLVALRDRYSIFTAVTGTETQTEDLAGLLPDWFTTIRGRDASSMMGDFQVMQTPSIFEIEGGKVTGRAVAGYGLTNFLNLVDAREASDAAKFAGSAGASPIDLQVSSRARQTDQEQRGVVQP